MAIFVYVQRATTKELLQAEWFRIIQLLAQTPSQARVVRQKSKENDGNGAISHRSSVIYFVVEKKLQNHMPRHATKAHNLKRALQSCYGVPIGI